MNRFLSRAVISDVAISHKGLALAVLDKRWERGNS